MNKAAQNACPVFPEIELVYADLEKRARIISWWDMLQIETRSFLASLTYISGVVSEYKLLLQAAAIGAPMAATMTRESHAMAIAKIKNLQSNCHQHGLKTSERFAAAAENSYREALLGGFSEFRNFQRVVSSLEALVTAVISEAEGRKFYLLAGDVNDNHDDADELFGADVVDAFPQAAFDIAEAGKCLSFGLWTACVMHTMRILETGLQALAEHVGVGPSENWNKTLNEIEAELRKVSKKTDGPEAEQWAAEAGTHLRFIKNAWRNQSMHHLSKYDEREAREIFGNAKSFMSHMAEMTNRNDA